MNVAQTKAMMLYTAEKMVESEPTLTALDQVIGDGDHGIGMQRGFAAVMVQLQDPAFHANDIGDFFTQVGTKLMTSMGGASGAIFGTLFRAGGKSITGEMTLNSNVLCKLLNDGWQAVYLRGNAKPGDKTMVDALAAAAETAQKTQDEPLKQALPQIAKAAMDGAEQTKQMIAVFGRAKNLGERAIGHVDPGSVSMAYILQYMSDYLNQ
ncbi:dihydroxyacetone kinase subunit DhaL [Orbus sasakiae]|uniref:Dihydroxyacetone kinase subunit DhaL n=1 Tax=Orbus sasakiae TaxID=1078475 RepID=A0ABP9NEC0_9GAMM